LSGLVVTIIVVATMIWIMTALDEAMLDAAVIF
jgi:heme/copper-type cytochrome/quinol oxidase subunit 4